MANKNKDTELTTFQIVLGLLFTVECLTAIITGSNKHAVYATIFGLFLGFTVWQRLLK